MSTATVPRSTEAREPETNGREGLTSRQRAWLVGIVVVAAIVRLAWVLYVPSDPPTDWYLAGDQFSYFHYGQELAAGHGYISYVTGDATAYYPIGYPGLLAGVFWLVQHTPIPDNLMAAAFGLHLVLGTASVLLVFVIGRALFGTTAGLVAAGLTAVFPNLVFQTATLQLETAYIFSALAALAVLVTHDWAGGPPSLRRLLLFGLVLGSSVLVRPFSAAFLLGLLLAVLATRAGWRRALEAVAWPTLVVVAMSAPWTIRNAVAMDAFIPSSTNMGDTLCLDRSLDARGGFRFADHDGCVDPGLDEVSRNSGNTRKAIEFVLEHPERELLQIVRRAKFMFEHDHDGIIAVETLGAGRFLDDGGRRLLERSADGFFFVVLALGVAGLPLLAARRPPERRPQRLIVLVAMLSLLAIALLLWGNVRFHVPLLPFFAISAAAAVDRTADAVRRRTIRADAP